MSDPGSVAAAYAIVLGGLTLYVGSIVRRDRAARDTARALHTARALERERTRDSRDPAAGSVSHAASEIETPR